MISAVQQVCRRCRAAFYLLSSILFLSALGASAATPIEFRTDHMTGRPLTNALVRFEPLGITFNSNRLVGLVPFTNRTDYLGNFATNAIAGTYRVTIEHPEIDTVYTNCIPDTNVTVVITDEAYICVGITASSNQLAWSRAQSDVRYVAKTNGWSFNQRLLATNNAVDGYMPVAVGTNGHWKWAEVSVGGSPTGGITAATATNIAQYFATNAALQTSNALWLTLTNYDTLTSNGLYAIISTLPTFSDATNVARFFSTNTAMITSNALFSFITDLQGATNGLHATKLNRTNDTATLLTVRAQTGLTNAPFKVINTNDTVTIFEVTTNNLVRVYSASGSSFAYLGIAGLPIVGSSGAQFYVQDTTYVFNSGSPTNVLRLGSNNWIGFGPSSAPANTGHDISLMRASNAWFGLIASNGAPGSGSLIGSNFTALGTIKGAAYQSSDGTAGATASTGGAEFKNGLYVGGTISGGGSGGITQVNTNGTAAGITLTSLGVSNTTDIAWRGHSNASGATLTALINESSGSGALVRSNSPLVRALRVWGNDDLPTPWVIELKVHEGLPNPTPFSLGYDISVDAGMDNVAAVGHGVNIYAGDEGDGDSFGFGGSLRLTNTAVGFGYDIVSDDSSVVAGQHLHIVGRDSFGIGAYLSVSGARSGAIGTRITNTAAETIEIGVTNDSKLTLARTLATFRTPVTATSFSGDGSSLTALNASQLSSGTVPNARLDSELQDWSNIPTGAMANVASTAWLTNWINAVSNRQPTLITNSFFVAAGAWSTNPPTLAEGGTAMAAPGYFSPGMNIGRDTWDFDDTTNECIALTTTLGNSFAGFMQVKLHFTCANTNPIVWELALAPRASNDIGTNFVYYTNVTARAHTASTHVTANFPQVSPTNYPAINLWDFRVRRLGTNASDTATGDARLYGAEFMTVHTNYFGGFY
jgi:hypothetical protein